MLVTQLCPTLCNPIDCRLQVSSAHGILQARILEWIVIPFSRGSSQPRDQTCVSYIGRQILYHWATREAYYNSTRMISHAVISLGSHAVSFQRAHMPGCKEDPSSLWQNIPFLYKGVTFSRWKRYLCFSHILAKSSCHSFFLTCLVLLMYWPFVFLISESPVLSVFLLGSLF